jgi:hypothetical protein
MDQQIEQRIRERAYALWELEGRPDGRDFAHWMRAVLEVADESRDVPQSLPEVATPTTADQTKDRSETTADSGGAVR